MAINDTIGNNNNATPAPAPTPRTPNVREVMNPTVVPQQQQPQAGFSFHRRPTFGAAPLGRNIGSEVLKSLQKALVEMVKNSDPDVEATVIPVDRANETALSFSALILCLRLKKAMTVGVAYYTLIIEDTGDVIDPTFQNIGTQKVRILRVAGDAWNKKLMDTVYEKVRVAFPQTNYYSAEACVIPRGFDVTNERIIHSTAQNALQAANIELTIRTVGFVDYQIQSAQNDSNLVVNMTFSREQRQNAVGEPMRSDVYLSFNSRQKAQTTYDQALQGPVDTLNNGDTNVNIAEICGFMDVVWADMSNNSYGANIFQQQQFVQQQQARPKWAARFVMTNMEATYASTITFQLLALITSLTVRDNNNWIQAFKPIPRVGGDIDMHDIGALGIEANLANNPSGFGDPIPTDKDHFRDENLGQMIGTLFHPGLTISLDVPECGPQTWYSNLFTVASNAPDPKVMMAATDVIYNAVNQLTGGIFSKHFPRGEAVFTDCNNRIHNGYYFDRNGKRDIRDIDYLAVANNLQLLGNDPRAIGLWSDTFLQVERPLVLRLEQREQIINALTKNTAVYTGFSQRLTWRDKFLDALAKSALESGLRSSFNSPMSGNDFNSSRGTASFLSESAMKNGGASIFSRFSGNNLNNVGNGFQHNTRYGRY